MEILPSLTFTVGFITQADKVLLLLRKKSPNKGKWNGVGGHIEPGESPYRCMQREITEETSFYVDNLHFGGILTWTGFEIECGGLYIFTSKVNSQSLIACQEGELAWHPLQFAFSDPAVVDNIHYFLPPVMSGKAAAHYHFDYLNGSIVKYENNPLPDEVDIHAPYWGGRSK